MQRYNSFYCQSFLSYILCNTKVFFSLRILKFKKNKILKFVECWNLAFFYFNLELRNWWQQRRLKGGFVHNKDNTLNVIHFKNNLICTRLAAWHQQWWDTKVRAADKNPLLLSEPPRSCKLLPGDLGPVCTPHIEVPWVHFDRKSSELGSVTLCFKSAICLCYLWIRWAWTFVSKLRESTWNANGGK